MKIKIEKLNWHNYANPKEHTIKLEEADAKIPILESEYYLKGHKDINQQAWWSLGKPTDSDDILMEGVTAWVTSGLTIRDSYGNHLKTVNGVS